MKNIRKFNTTVEMESAVLTEPYILYNEETDLVYINNTGSQPDMLKNYFRFTAVEDTSFGLNGMDVATSDGAAPDANIEISSDGATWNTWNFQPTELLAGETVYMRGNNPDGFSTINMNIGTGIVNMFILGDGKIECHGNIMSLLYADDFEDKLTIPSEWCFIHLFMACESLTTAPELPATTLTDGCYGGMFTSCTSLTTAPELPATTLTEFCYQLMFAICTNLSEITMLATDILESSCLEWVSNVSSTGTFVKHPKMTSLETGTSGIPNGWTVEDAVL